MAVDLRDFQKTKLYDAEDIVWGATKDTVPMFRDEDGVVKWVNKICRYTRIIKKYGRIIDEGPPIDVTFCKRSTWSLAESTLIKFAAGKDCEVHALLVIHELAHVFQYRLHPNAQVSAHGQEFCRIYLDLILIVFGREMHDFMIDSFEAHGVKY